MVIRKSKQRIAFEVFNCMFFLVFGFACLYPFYYILIYSLSIPAEAARGGIYFLPQGFTLDTYIAIFKIDNMGNAAFISVARTVMGTCFAVFSTSLFAFVLTQKKLKCRKILYRMMIATMYFSAGLIPGVLLIKHIGLMNNFLVYIIPTALTAFNVVLVKVYIEQLPASLEESATIDGAGPFVIYARIIFHLSLPILGTIAIFTAVGQWNTWFDNFLFVKSPKLKTLQYMLYLYTKDNESQQLMAAASQGGTVVNIAKVKMTPKAIRMCVTMVVTFPILLVYPFFQRYFVKGIMIGAIKG